MSEIVQALHNGLIQTGDRLRYARAEQRIDNNVAIEKFELFFVPVFFRNNNGWRTANRLQDFEIDFGVAMDFVFAGEQINKGINPFLNQLACNDEPIATVIPTTAKNTNGQFVKIFESVLNCIDHTNSGIFHKEDAGNAVLRSGKTIYFTKLFRRKNFHQELQKHKRKADSKERRLIRGQ